MNSAMFRIVQPSSGAPARIRYTTGLRVEGWADGHEVIVVGTDGRTVAVVDVNGHTGEFPFSEIDCGMEYMIDGQWMHESQPAALDMIEIRLAGTRDKPWGRAAERDRQDYI